MKLVVRSCLSFLLLHSGRFALSFGRRRLLMLVRMSDDVDLLALSLLRQICLINVPHRIPRVRQICEINVPNRMFFVRFSTIISHFSC